MYPSKNSTSWPSLCKLKIVKHHPTPTSTLQSLDR